jgi:hypothetical protein
MTTTTPIRPPAPARTRPPVPALAAAVLTLLMSAVGAYGAIYFTGLDGWDLMSGTFVTTYEYVALTGLAAALAMFRGSYLGRVGVLWYAAFQLVFTAYKLVVVHEGQAIPFGVLALTVLVLATRPSVRAYASR